MRVKKSNFLLFLIAVVIAIILVGCTQYRVRRFGGDMVLELPPNQKLEMVTWKDDDDSLWYLTRPMTDDDIAETHTFQQSSEFGVLEGTVTIIESKTTGEFESTDRGTKDD